LVSLGRGATGLLLDGIEPGDTLDRLLGDRRGLGAMDVDELAADLAMQATSRMAPEHRFRLMLRPPTFSSGLAGAVRISSSRCLAVGFVRAERLLARVFTGVSIARYALRRMFGNPNAELHPDALPRSGPGRVADAQRAAAVSSLMSRSA
jgi:hypothetical protein